MTLETIIISEILKCLNQSCTSSKRWFHASLRREETLFIPLLQLSYPVVMNNWSDYSCIDIEHLKSCFESFEWIIPQQLLNKDILYPTVSFHPLLHLEEFGHSVERILVFSQLVHWTSIQTATNRKKRIFLRNFSTKTKSNICANLIEVDQDPIERNYSQ